MSAGRLVSRHMADLTRRDVLSRRLATQRLTHDRLTSATDVVRLLGCVQSQEYAHALWSLGMRTSGLTAADVQAEFDRGDFLRTHILRPRGILWRLRTFGGFCRSRHREFQSSIRRSTAGRASIGPLWTLGRR